MIIPASKLISYMPGTTFPVPVWSEDGSLQVGHVGPNEYMDYARAGIVIGRAQGKGKRIKSLQLNTLTPRNLTRAERLAAANMVPYHESREKGDRNSIYRENFGTGPVPNMKRLQRDSAGNETGSLIRW